MPKRLSKNLKYIKSDLAFSAHPKLNVLSRSLLPLPEACIETSEWHRD